MQLSQEERIALRDELFIELQRYSILVREPVMKR